MGQGFPSQRLGINLSAGTALVQTGTAVLSNSNGVSFGVQLSASSNVITVSYDGFRSISAGTQVATGPELVFANSNGISFGISGSSQITAKMPSISLYRPDSDIDFAIPLQGSSNAINVSVRRISVPFQISATELDLLGALTVGGSTAGSLTLSACLYTYNASTASSLSSGSAAFTFNSGTNSTAASIYGGNSGTRWRSMSINTWNVTPGEYLLAIGGSINGPAGTTGSVSLFGNSSVPIAGAIGGGNQSGYWGDGVFASGTGAFPSSIHISALVQTGSSAAGQPNVRLMGTGA